MLSRNALFPPKTGSTQKTQKITFKLWVLLKRGVFPIKISLSSTVCTFPHKKTLLLFYFPPFPYPPPPLCCSHFREMRSYHSLLCYQWYKLTFPPFQNLKLLSSFLLTLTTDSSVVARTEQMLSILSHFNAFPYSLRQERRKRTKKTADWGQGGGEVG